MRDLDNWAKEPGSGELELSRLPALPRPTPDDGDNDYHGGDGPVSVTTSKPGVNPLFEAMIEAGAGGLPAHGRSLRLSARRFCPMDRTVTPQGRRASTARGYLDQAKSRPNLTIRTHAMTDHIIFDGKRAVGVEWLEGDSTIPTRWRNGQQRSAVMCRALTFLPQILQRSGVGTELLAERIFRWCMNYPASAKIPLRPFRRCICIMSAKRTGFLYPALQWWNQPKIGAEVAARRHWRWCQQPL